MPNNRQIGAEGTVGPDVDNPMGPAVGGEDPIAAREKKLQFVAAELKRMRFFRRQYDIRRAHYYRQYLGQRDDRLYADNVTKRSNTFVPYPFSNVETIVSRVMDAFFSMEEWFEVKEDPPYSSSEQADQMQLGLQRKLHKAQIIPHIEEFIRNSCIYGFAGIKLDWDFSYDVVTVPKPIYAQEPILDKMSGQPVMDPQSGQPANQNILDPMTGQPILLDVVPEQQMVPKACPRFTSIDIYDLMVDPDGAYVAHLTERTWRDLRTEFETHPERFFPEGMEKLKSRINNEEDPDEIVIRLAEFWNQNDNTWTIMTFGEDPEGISFKDLRASFRATAYSPYKRRMYGGETIMLWDGDNPFSHKRCPILYTSFIKLPNEVFGLGAVEIITDLSESLNRFVNMINDNWNIGINHRYAYDINAEIDHEALDNFNIPGGKVGVVGNPNEVIFPLPQFTPASQDYQILDLFKGMIEMSSGVTDFYQKGTGGSGGNKTATGIQQIIGETNYRLKTFIRNLELDILQPTLEMCASMIQQFVDEPFSVGNPKGGQMGQPQSMMIDPKQLVGTYQYNIVAANYATSKVVRQRNMMALANIIAQSPYVNEYVALKELLKVFEVKHIDQLLKSPEQVQMEQQQQMQQQMQMQLLEHQLQTQHDVAVAEASPSPIVGAGGEPGSSVGGHQKPPGSGKKKKPGARGPRGGKPAKHQFEGKVPGAGLTQLVRELGGNNGVGGLGLEGLGESPNV